MKAKGVNGILHRFVGAAEPKQIRRYGPMSFSSEHGNHFAIKVAPRGFAVEAKEDLIGVPGPLIQIVHAQALVPLKIFHIMGQEGKTGKVGKAFFWRSKRVNHI
jgi:hypothetical protein